MDVPTVEDFSYSLYRELAARMHQVVIDHPVCEVCEQRPSVQINRWGRIRACCVNCLDDEWRRFNESRLCEENDENRPFI